MLFLNLSAAKYQLGDYTEAEQLYALAREADPESAEAFTYIARGAESGAARAAEQAAVSARILFVEEEE